MRIIFRMFTIGTEIEEKRRVVDLMAFERIFKLTKIIKTFGVFSYLFKSIIGNSL